MFVASSLYNYATSKGSQGSNATAGSLDNKVKRRPTRRESKHNPNQNQRPSSPPPSYASITSDRNLDADGQEKDPKLLVVDSIIAEDDLYKVLAVPRNAKPEEIRRGFLNRSRVCHPDKFPTYPASTIAFQKVALAYETLSKPSSRRMYDVSGRTDFAAAVNNSSHPMSTDSDVGLGEETLNGVLYSILCEFLEGDFDMIRVFVQAMNDGGSGRSGSSGSGLQVGAETVENLEGAFRKVREMMLAGKRYVKVIQNELIRLYEIQQNLRSLSYFDVFGRLRLTLQLARVTLSIPMAVDQAMKEQEQEPQTQEPENQEWADELASASEGEEVISPIPPPAEFGVASEDTAEDTAAVRARRHRQRRRARRRAARANLEEAKSKGDHEEQDKENANKAEPPHKDAPQPRGLLGPTTSGLLKGVIKVLETSEAWVPGQRTPTPA